MANTFSQVYLHIVFSTKNREPLIKQSWEETLYKYVSGIITNKGHKPLAINGMPDHIHLFIGFKPIMSISDLVREIKKSTSSYINDNKLLNGKFYWQEGYGVFSNSHSQIKEVCTYIQNQKNHHKIISFKEEYLSILKQYEVEYDEKYLLG
jgi:putative transposase